ncbi:MAG: hypothetical protein HKN23_02795, partial [Verrucomicrobiales bacterium]|nr:hypothetical protein [Verrucomicrobiales bacterium]
VSPRSQQQQEQEDVLAPGVPGAKFIQLQVLFVLVFVVPLIAVAAPFLFMGNPETLSDDQAAIFGLVIIGSYGLFLVCMFVYTIISYIYLYRGWLCIQGLPGVQSTPGKAIGMLFVPFYNIYWIFIAFSGWAKDYNRFCTERGVNYFPRANEGLFMAFCVCAIVFPIITPFLHLACMSQMCKAINFTTGNPSK